MIEAAISEGNVSTADVARVVEGDLCAVGTCSQDGFIEGEDEDVGIQVKCKGSENWIIPVSKEARSLKG